jgi:hypothetical protein
MANYYKEFVGLFEVEFRTVPLCEDYPDITTPILTTTGDDDISTVTWSRRVQDMKFDWDTTLARKTVNKLSQNIPDKKALKRLCSEVSNEIEGNNVDSYPGENCGIKTPIYKSSDFTDLSGNRGQVEFLPSEKPSFVSLVASEVAKIDL